MSIYMYIGIGELYEMVDESASHTLKETIIMHHDQYELETQTISKLTKKKKIKRKQNNKKKIKEKHTNGVACDMRI